MKPTERILTEKIKLGEIYMCQNGVRIYIKGRTDGSNYPFAGVLLDTLADATEYHYTEYGQVMLTSGYEERALIGKARISI